MTDRNVQRLAAALAALFAATSCQGGGDDAGPVLDPPVADLTGTFSVHESTYGNCQGTTYPVTRNYTATATQSGNSLTIRDGATGASYGGTISGDQVNLNVSIADLAGTTSGTLTGKAASSGDGLSGTLRWSWTSSSGGAPPCTGWTYVTASRTGSVPEAPTDATATAGWRQVTISFAYVPGVLRYEIHRSTTAGGAAAGSSIGTTANLHGTYEDRWLTNETTYYYVVRAVDVAGVTSQSGELAATPSSSSPRPTAPTGLTATAGQGKVTLTWNAVAGAASYRVYLASAANSMTTYDALKSQGNFETSATGVTLLYSGTVTPRYYTVTTWTVEGESDPCDEVTATPY